MAKSREQRDAERRARERDTTAKDLSRIVVGTRVYVVRWWRTRGVVRGSVIEKRPNGTLRVDLGERAPDRYVWLRAQDWQPDKLTARQSVVMLARGARARAAMQVEVLGRVIRRELRNLERTKISVAWWRSQHGDTPPPDDLPDADIPEPNMRPTDYVPDYVPDDVPDEVDYGEET